MAITKSNTALLTAVTTSQTSSAIPTSGDYADEVYVSIVVVGTPSGAASFFISWSPDNGTTYYVSQTYSTPLVAGTYDWTISLPVTCTKVEITFVTQTGGTSSTLTAQLGQVTAV